CSAAYWDALLWASSDGRCCAAVNREGATLGQWDNPLDALDWMSRTQHLRTGSMGRGRWIGDVGYDLGRWFEDLPAQAAERLHLPLLALVHVPDAATASAGGQPDPRCGAADAPDPAVVADNLRSDFTQEAYEQAVARAVSYIAAG